MPIAASRTMHIGYVRIPTTISVVDPRCSAKRQTRCLAIVAVDIEGPLLIFQMTARERGIFITRKQKPTIVCPDFLLLRTVAFGRKAEVFQNDLNQKVLWRPKPLDLTLTVRSSLD